MINVVTIISITFTFFCSCETDDHFLLHYLCFTTQSRVLSGLISKFVDIDIMHLSSKEFCNLLLKGHPTGGVWNDHVNLWH